MSTLSELIDADRWIDRLTQQRGHLPESVELAAVEDELRRRVAELKVRESARANAAAALEQSQQRSEPLRQRLATLRAAARSATGGSRDLVALEKEITHVASDVARYDDQELILMESLEPLEAAVRDLKHETQPLIATRATLTATIAELQASIDDEVAAKRQARDDISAQLPDGVRRAYDEALRRAGVSGGAYVDGNRCDGCRIALSPLDLDRWRQGSAAVSACPECGRVWVPCSS